MLRHNQWNIWQRGRRDVIARQCDHNTWFIFRFWCIFIFYTPNVAVCPNVLNEITKADKKSEYFVHILRVIFLGIVRDRAQVMTVWVWTRLINVSAEWLEGLYDVLLTFLRLHSSSLYSIYFIQQLSRYETWQTSRSMWWFLHVRELFICFIVYLESCIQYIGTIFTNLRYVCVAVQRTVVGGVWNMTSFLKSITKINVILCFRHVCGNFDSTNNLHEKYFHKFLHLRAEFLELMSEDPVIVNTI